jgi:hypothetical protein
MSALMAERRERADEGRQESLFDALAPPRAPVRNPWAPPLEPPRDDAAALPLDAPAPGREDAVAPPLDAPAPEREDAVAPPLDVPAPVAPADEIGDVVDIPPSPIAPDTEAAHEPPPPRAAGAPLAGPTLDDVMSRVWEGLVTGLPAYCPVCHGEVAPSLERPLSGLCQACETMID